MKNSSSAENTAASKIGIASFSRYDNSDATIAILVVVVVGKLSTLRAILTARFRDTSPLEECLCSFARHQGSHSQIINFSVLSEYEEVFCWRHIGFFNQAMTHIGLMVFMLTLLDNTLCLAAVEVLSRTAYNCSPRISSVSNNA